MEKRVKIKIVGTQRQQAAEPEKMEFITYGVLARYGQKLRVTYQESDLFGMNGVSTSYVYDGVNLYMERTGKINARMLFKAGEKTECMYGTEYGTLILGVTSRRVSCTLSDDGGKLYLEYGVELNHNFIGLNTFDISVETVKAEPTEAAE